MEATAVGLGAAAEPIEADGGAGWVLCDAGWVCTLTPSPPPPPAGVGGAAASPVAAPPRRLVQLQKVEPKLPIQVRVPALLVALYGVAQSMWGDPVHVPNCTDQVDQIEPSSPRCVCALAAGRRRRDQVDGVQREGPGRPELARNLPGGGQQPAGESTWSAAATPRGAQLQSVLQLHPTYAWDSVQP